MRKITIYNDSGTDGDLLIDVVPRDPRVETQRHRAEPHPDSPGCVQVDLHDGDILILRGEGSAGLAVGQEPGGPSKVTKS